MKVVSIEQVKDSKYIHFHFISIFMVDGDIFK